MLDRNAGKTRTYGILISLELEDGVCTTEQAADRLAGSLTWVEGVGSVTVDVLGEIDVLDAPPEDAA